MRAIIQIIRTLLGRASRRSGSGLTEIEYEAITLIAQEGRGAHAKAREQAEYCRRRGSEQGRQFWSQVAEEVSMRTNGKPASPSAPAKSAREPGRRV
jgi:hypothetical protein